MVDRWMARLATLLDAATREQGQGLVEYAFMLLLVALVAIGSLTALGASLSPMFQAAVDAF